MDETTKLSDEDLAAIEARVAATTEGPWRVGLTWDKKEETLSVEAGHRDIVLVYSHPGVSPISGGSESEGIGNKYFIAHAREDVPALVAEIRRMRADLVEWEEVLAPLWVERHETEKQQLRDEITSLTASLEVVDRRLTEEGYAPEDQIRSARLHIKAALEGKARPLDYQNDQLRQAQSAITEAHTRFTDSVEGDEGVDDDMDAILTRYINRKGQ